MTVLDRLLLTDRDTRAESAPPAALVISAVAGSGGVGKTALAVHWSHRIRDAFPDGQLYVNLRGYDLGEPVTTADALAGFLRALGVTGHDIPADTEERAAQYRSLLDGRRILILLDNAASIEQVRLLLPGTSSCVVVVTSRDSLAGLVARHGAQRLDLDILPLDDAVGLLRTLIGPRVDEEPAAAATLAGYCARLPLALRVAAELAAARPDVPLAQLAGELSGEQRRLDLLDAGGDSRTAVRTVFSWSCRSLPPDAARAFRLLGLHPGPDLDAYAAAALIGDTAERARDLLGLLARAHLIHQARPGRYGMHDLLRAYARDPAVTQDARTGDGRRAALTRMFDYYLAAAVTALSMVVPGERGRWSHVQQPAMAVPALDSSTAARGWLDAEWDTLGAAAYAAAGGWPGHVARISTIMLRYVEVGGYYPYALTLNTNVLRSARQAGDRAGEAYALNALGFIERRDRYPEAIAYFNQALALFSEIGDRFGAACALTNLGSADWRHGHYLQAASHRRRALALFSEIGDDRGAARALKGLGLVEFRRGRYPQAADHFQASLALYRKLDDQAHEAQALGNLGMVDGRLGDYPSAVGQLRQALRLFREIGDEHGAAGALAGLGSVSCQQGHHQEAADYLRQALPVFREIGDRTGQAQVLNGLGDVLLASARPGQAQGHYADALVLASQVDDKYEQARAHDGMAGSYRAAGDHDLADEHRARAMALYTELGL
jgi:tetratricopeptide (TPR) repeat protein